MIYFILDRSARLVKIGRSESPRERLNELQTGNGSKLELYAVLPGDVVSESMFHREFEMHRVHGEWFRPHRNIKRAIDSYGALEESEY